jgi:hypothetical protein
VRLMNVAEFFEKQHWIIPLFVPLLSLGLAAVAGHRLSNKWDERRKRRELELALVNGFYHSYGEFCAVWKYWNQSLDFGTREK